MSKNIKILISFFFIFIILSGLFFFFKFRNINNTSELFILKDTTDILKIIISKDSANVIISRNNKKKKWTLDNRYPANKKNVKKLFQALTEVKISKPVINSKKDSLIKNIKKNGKIIKVYNFNNKLIKEIKTGNYIKQLEGTYMYNPKANSIFIVNIPGLENNLNLRYNINPVYWLKPEIFSYNPNDIKEITLNYPDAISKSFKLIILKDTANLMYLHDNKHVKHLNLSKAGSFLSYFMNVKFSPDTSNTQVLKKELFKRIPYAEITVTDKYQHTKNVKLFKIKNNTKPETYDLNKLYAILNNNYIVTVKYIDFDLILKDINYFAN